MPSPENFFNLCNAKSFPSFSSLISTPEANGPCNGSFHLHVKGWKIYIREVLLPLPGGVVELLNNQQLSQLHSFLVEFYVHVEV